MNLPQLELITSPDWSDYALIDSGNGQKLEQFGPYRLIRPEPEAIWQPAQSQKEWERAHGIFVATAEKNGGHWEFSKKVPERWTMAYKNFSFWAQTTASKQLGVFPEQAVQWDWVYQKIKSSSRPLKVLNLFGYTGMASLSAAVAGAQVTHLDASKKVNLWGKDNQALSGIDESSIRWLVDDAFKFVKREVRRGNQYDGIILDPPKFGRGPKGEVWEFYKILPDLLDGCRQILSPKPQFIVLTAYAVKASALTLYYATEAMMKAFKGTTTAGEVVLTEQSGQRALSMAIYARWSSA